MTPNNNLNILPFYSSIDEQNHRKEYAFGAIYPLLSGQRRLLPFQIARPHNSGAWFTSITLVNYEDGTRTNIQTEATAAGGLYVKEFADEGYDLIINRASLNFPNLVMEVGRYYLEIESGGQSYYSEIFTVAADLSRTIKLEYFNEDALHYTGGRIDYTTPFRNYLFINSEIGKPEYPFTEQAQERDGHTFVEQQISEKKYRFEFPAPEYLCDALRIVRMHDKIRLYQRGKIYDVESIVISPKWQQQGDLAIVEVEFECDTIMKKVGKGITPTGLGDFNQDYNADYFNI